MKVENLAITLRKRSNWEAIDLGFTLARKWFFRLWSAWTISALPVLLLVLLITALVEDENAKAWIFVLFWWCKPIYEQPLLYILSRQLFSESVNFRDIYKNYFKIIKPQLGALLLWRRLSLSRSFNNPVAMLENLTGSKRRERLNVLHSQQSSTAQWLTIVCLHIEYIIWFALILFVFSMIPSGLSGDFYAVFLGNREDLLLTTITYIAYFIAMSIIAPMYVAAGFALYINRRIKLEGWDIELAFKRMNNRIENKTLVNTNTSSLLASVAFVTCLSLSVLTPTKSFAEDNHISNKETAKATIEKVLQNDDFGEITTKEQWVFVGNNLEQDKDAETPEWLSDFFRWLVEKVFGGDANTGLNILELLIWLLIAGLILWLAKRYSHLLSWLGSKKHNKKKMAPIPNKILGMEMNKESLPDDVLTSFKEFINNKQYREALSLLYRATLSAIVHRGDIEIPASATEQECNQMVANKRDLNEATFFNALTQAWIKLAYADHLPTEETLSKLSKQWPEYYLSEETRDKS